MKAHLYFAFRDLWIGAFWSRGTRTLLVGISFFGIMFHFRPPCLGWRDEWHPDSRCTNCGFHQECTDAE